MELIKIGVLGVGNMGSNHVRNILELPNLYEMIGCYDKSPESLNRVKENFGVECFDDVEQLLEKTDAVVVAVPSSLHKEYGLLSSRYGKHTFIEKPIALCEVDGKLLCEAYSSVGKVLMVGHIERYNPAISELKKILANECDIIAIDAKRLSPFDPRIGDTSVIFDLMIHDLDIVLNYLQPSTPASFSAVANIVKNEHFPDYVQAIIQHESGAISTIAASRVTENKIRTVDVHTKQSLIQADLLNKTLQITRKTNFDLKLGYSPIYKQENIIEKIMLPNIEPLKAELIEFASAINENRTPLTCGKVATKALHYAEKIHNLTKDCPRLS